MQVIWNYREIVLMWNPQNTCDKSTLFKVATWWHQAKSHCMNQCLPRSMSPCGDTRSQWVMFMTVGKISLSLTITNKSNHVWSFFTAVLFFAFVLRSRVTGLKKLAIRHPQQNVFSTRLVKIVNGVQLVKFDMWLAVVKLHLNPSCCRK